MESITLQALIMVAAKPDCTGQRFGLLTVLGKGDVRKKNGQSNRLWNLQCDCGNIVSLVRGDFDRAKGGQRSCGCLGKNRRKELVDNKRRPRDITGQRFGSLVAVKLTGKKKDGKPTWLLQCDCGKTTEMSLTRLGSGYRLNCGDLSHQPGLHYPPTPKPYPKEAGKLLEKYLYLTRPIAEKFDSRIQDERLDRLIRAAWIVTYRRQQGEQISETHERRYIWKCLRFARSAVKLRRFVEAGGISRYTFARYKQIGSEMTNVTSFTEAVSTVRAGKTQPDSMLSVRPRHLKFKRC